MVAPTQPREKAFPAARSLGEYPRTGQLWSCVRVSVCSVSGICPVCHLCMLRWCGIPLRPLSTNGARGALNSARKHVHAQSARRLLPFADGLPGSRFIAAAPARISSRIWGTCVSFLGSGKTTLLLSLSHLVPCRCVQTRPIHCDRWCVERPKWNRNLAHLQGSESPRAHATSVVTYASKYATSSVLGVTITPKQGRKCVTLHRAGAAPGAGSLHSQPVMRGSSGVHGSGG